jgi:hypothetical protein
MQVNPGGLFVFGLVSVEVGPEEVRLDEAK